ncbi:MAG: trigger factor [Bacteroidetes bacterium]|nr:trigger factor [Bacteroidota bacterium]
METEHKFTDLENSAVELTLTIPKDTVAVEYQKIVNKYVKTLQVKGFRKGKAPISVIEKKYGSALQEEAMYSMIEASVEKTLENVEDEYKPLQQSTPTLVDEENLKFDNEADFSFALTYDIYPKFEIPEYTGHEITFPGVTVDDEPIQEELTKLLDQNAVVIEKDGPAEKDSIVTIDYFEMDENDELLDGTKREDYVFTVGTEYNIYKFDNDIIGMKAGDTKIIEKSFGEDFEISEYAGKTVRVSVTLKVVKQRDIPELDDEFAQDVSEDYKTLDDLKQATRKKLEEGLEARIRETKISNLYEKLLENLTISLPESMIHAELENSWRKFASQSGMNEEQLLQILGMQGQTKENLLIEWKPQAERSLKIQLMVDKITLNEKIEVADEEVTENAQLFEGIEDARQKEYYQLLWKEDQKMQKTVDLLLEKSTFTEGETTTYTEFMKGKASPQ